VKQESGRLWNNTSPRFADSEIADSSRSKRERSNGERADTRARSNVAMALTTTSRVIVG
jgi:hypothetical protein